LLFAGVAVAGCASIPEDAYKLPPSELKERDAQTRIFAAADEAQILRASTALLQDMEYNIDAIEYPLGVLTATKMTDADDAAQKAGLASADIAMLVLYGITGINLGAGGYYLSADDKIKLTMTLVVLPSLSNKGHFAVRATLQSELIAKSEQVKVVQIIKDPVIYQEIFAKLSKSLSLEKAGQ